jgi:hypothetical protein
LESSLTPSLIVFTFSNRKARRNYQLPTHPAEILGPIVDKAERVLCERVQHVEAVDLVSLGDGQVKADEGKRVGLGDAQGGIEASDKVRHLVETDKLGRVGVVPVKRELQDNQYDLYTF